MQEKTRKFWSIKPINWLNAVSVSTIRVDWDKTFALLTVTLTNSAKQIQFQVAMLQNNKSYTNMAKTENAIDTANELTLCL